MADRIELKAMSPTARDAEWLANSLAAYHGVEIERPSAEAWISAVLVAH